MQNFPLDSWFWCIYNFFIFLQVSFKNSPARHTIPHKREENTAWEDIRKLDEEQNWTERTQVVTKEEHNFYIETAKVRNEEFSSTELLIFMSLYRVYVHIDFNAFSDIFVGVTWPAYSWFTLL